MDRSRRLLGRVPGLSFFLAAALTVALEAALGVGASVSLASGLPSVSAPNVSSTTSGLSSTASSVTSSASSAVSSSTSTATGAVSSAAHSVTSTASSGQQSLVNTASNLTSTATSTVGSAGQTVTSTAAGSSAAASTPTGSTPAAAAAPTGSAASAGGSSTWSAGQASGGGGGASSSGSGASGSGASSRAAQHQWFVRRLVTRLSGCVEELPQQSQRVLVLAAGIGSGQPNSAGRVAHILHISVSREERIETSAVTSLQQAARHGGCQSSGVAVPVSAVALGLQPGLALVTGPQTGAAAFLPAAQTLGTTSGLRHKSAVRAMRISRRRPGGGSSGSGRVEKSAIGTPSPAASVSAWIFILLGLLLGAGFLVMGRQRRRARPSGTRGAELAAAGAAAAAAHVGEQTGVSPAPDIRQGGDAAAAWDPPTVIAPMGAMAADAPAPLVPDSPVSGEPASAFVPADFVSPAPGPSAPTPADFSAPAPAATPPHDFSAVAPAPVTSAASSEPASLAEDLAPSASAGRPRVQAGRNWLRRHRQAAAMIGAVAGAALALMVSTADRSARLIVRRRPGRRR